MSGDPESSVIDSSAHLDNGRNISARQAITNLIGTKVTCTMLDGRKIVGSLVCVDRLKNIILSDCVEERIIHSSYYSNHQPATTRVVSRSLTLALVPGQHLVSAQIRRTDYDKALPRVVA